MTDSKENIDLITTEGQEIKALCRIAGLISSAVHLDTVLSAILKVMGDTLQMERATLALFTEKRQRLVIRASYGLSVEEEKRGIYKLNEGIYGQIFSTAYPFIVPDVGNEPLFLNRTGSRTTLGKSKISFIGVPVVLGDNPVGVLSVDRLFGSDISLEEDVRFLTVVAALIAQFLSLNKAIARGRRKLALENSNLKAQLHGRYRKHYIIGHSKPMQEVFHTIERVALSQATVLILGESGTGKELIAHAIHEAGPRNNKPFIKINCAALPENLLESELFGHEKGAFTGADAIRIGRFELADQGTMFFDEIGELPISLQAKLLRVLQEQQFERLGSAKTIQVDVRIIAATNIDLENAVREGRFRNDLFYRLNVVPITPPPLRERKDDIPLLIEYFLNASNQRNNSNIRMAKEFLDILVNYEWPGNVRELQNLIERLVILAMDDILQAEDLPENILKPENKTNNRNAAGEKHILPGAARLPGNNYLNPEDSRNKIKNISPPDPGSLKELERERIREALIRHGWVQARAARELGLTQRQIGYRIKKFNLQRSDFR